MATFTSDNPTLGVHIDGRNRWIYFVAGEYTTTDPDEISELRHHPLVSEEGDGSAAVYYDTVVANRDTNELFRKTGAARDPISLEIVQEGAANTFTTTQTINPSTNATALSITANPDQTDANALVTIDSDEQAAPFQQWIGHDRGNGTDYMAQIGGMSSSAPHFITNCAIVCNGQANEPYDSADLTIAGNSTYMVGIRSDVAANPSLVIQGGNNAAPLISGYAYNGTKAVDMMETGQLRLPVQGASGGLLIGTDISMYHTTVNAAPVLRVGGVPVYVKAFHSDSEAANTKALDFRASGDTQPRFTINNGGGISWGAGGASAQDISLARSGATFDLHLTGGGLNIASSGEYLRWGHAGNEQTTVGAAGAASALPATPTKYLKVKDSDGTVLVIPAFAAS